MVVAESARQPIAFNPVSLESGLSRVRSLEFVGRLLMDEAEVVKIADLLWERKQIILFGPPGTAKTYLARDLTDYHAVKFVQFHPPYTLGGLLRRLPAETRRQRHPDLNAADRAVP